MKIFISGDSRAGLIIQPDLSFFEVAAEAVAGSVECGVSPTAPGDNINSSSASLTGRSLFIL